mmetsp:Transcript_55744/g.180983  ORF Transcript_55744/g.180983 Transcript_55744/m.180983 type:complete len:313 (+) Transcript_55744:191-1129(+)
MVRCDGHRCREWLVALWELLRCGGLRGQLSAVAVPSCVGHAGEDHARARPRRPDACRRLGARRRRRRVRRPRGLGAPGADGQPSFGGGRLARLTVDGLIGPSASPHRLGLERQRRPRRRRHRGARLIVGRLVARQHLPDFVGAGRVALGGVFALGGRGRISGRVAHRRGDAGLGGAGGGCSRARLCPSTAAALCCSGHRFVDLRARRQNEGSPRAAAAAGAATSTALRCSDREGSAWAACAAIVAAVAASAAADPAVAVAVVARRCLPLGVGRGQPAAVAQLVGQRHRGVRSVPGQDVVPTAVGEGCYGRRA